MRQVVLMTSHQKTEVQANHEPPQKIEKEKEKINTRNAQEYEHYLKPTKKIYKQ